MYTIIYKNKKLCGYYPNSNGYGKLSNLLSFNPSSSVAFSTIEEAQGYINYIKKDFASIELDFANAEVLTKAAKIISQLKVAV